MKNCPECGIKQLFEERYCECGYDFENQVQSNDMDYTVDPSEIQPINILPDKKSIYTNLYFYILIIISSMWIIYNSKPIIPLGFIPCLFVTLLSKNYKMVIFSVLACIVGFMGTGISISITNLDNYMGINIGLNIGIDFIYNIITN